MNDVFACSCVQGGLLAYSQKIELFKLGLAPVQSIHVSYRNAIICQKTEKLDYI